MEDESSPKWCELTFVQACPTLENYKIENSIFRQQTLNVNKQNLIKPQKRIGQEKLSFIQFKEVDCLVPVPVVFESA